MDIVVIGVLLLIDFFYLRKDIMHPTTIFLSMWCLILVLWKANIYDYYTVADRTINIVYIGVIGFVMGSIINIRKKKNIISRPFNAENINFNYYFWGLVLLICTMSIMPVCIIQIGNLLNGATIIDNKIDLVLGKLGFGVLVTYITRPLMLISQSIAAYAMVDSKKRRGRRFLCIMWLVSNLIYFLSTGSKVSIVWNGIEVIICWFFFGEQFKEINFDKKRKNIIIYVVLAFSAFMLCLGYNFQAIHNYIAGCIPCLDQKLSLKDLYGPTYGFMSLNSFARMVDKTIGLPASCVAPYELGERYRQLCEYTINIRDDIKYNAFVTIFYSWYIDFGIFGVFIGMLLSGSISNFVYTKFLDKKDEFYLLLYLFVLCNIFTSMVRFQFVIIGTGMQLMLLLFVVRPILKYGKNITYNNVM